MVETWDINLSHDNLLEIGQTENPLHNNCDLILENRPY